MAKTNKKQALRERSLARIAASAYKLFVINGYHGTSLETIAGDADLTKGAVYFYLKSKEHLVLYLLGELQSNMVERMIAPLHATDGTAIDRIVRYIHRGANFGSERPDELMFMILIAIEFGRQDNAIATAIKKLYMNIYSALESTIQDGQDAGEVSSELQTPRELASMIIAVHDGMMLEWHRSGGEIRGPNLVRNVRHMLMQGIVNDQALAYRL